MFSKVRSAEVTTTGMRQEGIRPMFEHLEPRLLLDAAYIITHPVNTTVTEGWKGQFAVEVGGTAPIDYQWQEDDGGGWSNISWASGTLTSSPDTTTYWTPITVLADDGTLIRCVVSNAEGGETSSVATLYVIPSTAAQEDWTGTNGDPWDPQWTIEPEPGMTVSTTIQSNEGRLAKAYADPDGMVVAYINTINAETIDQVVDFRISSNAMGFGLAARRADANSDTYYYVEVGSQSDYLRINKIVDGTITDLDTVHPFTILSNVDYKMRFFCRTEGSNTLLQAKVWEVGQVEPPWQAEITDDAASLQGVSGRFGLWYDTFKHRQVYTDNYSAGIGMGAPNSLPSAHIMADPVVIEQPNYVHFDGSGSSDPDGYIASYDWDFGDTLGGSGATIRHNYASPGPYTVTLTVTDNDGAPHQDTKDIIVYATNGDELTIDNPGAVVTGPWTPSIDTPGYYAADYLHDGNAEKGTKKARYVPELDGVYDVYIRYADGQDRADNVPVTIVHAGGTGVVTVDQTSGGGMFNYLGTYTFASGSGHYVEIATTGTNGYVVADAFRFVPASNTLGITLSLSGVAQVPIYIASNASTESQDAANALESVLEQVTGGNFVQETYTSQTAPGIYVGAAYELGPILPGVDETLGPLNHEGVYVHTRDEGLVIAGKTPDPVMDAVYTFLKHDQVGVRYYAPWENWWVIPSSSTLTVNMNLTTEPWAPRRTLGTGGYENSEYRSSGDNLDWKWDEYTTQNRLMGWMEGSVHHNYGSVVPSTLFAEHPEYFAWRTAYGEWRMSQINTRHPAVIELAINFVIDYLDTNPGTYVVPLSPNDGGGFCECTQWGCANHTFSDNILEFTNNVAAGVASRRPDLADRYIGYYIYGGVAPPPTEPHTQQDNVLGVITTGFMSGQRVFGQIDNWVPEVGALGIRDYHALLPWSHSRPDFWTAHITYLEEAMPYYENNNIIFYNTEGCKSLFPHIQNYWVTSEYFWSGHLDMDAMLDQFYGDLFGNAADAAREYWDRWNTKQAWTWRTLTLSYDSMDAALAAESDPDVVSRIDDIRNYLHYLKLRLDYGEAVVDGLTGAALEPYVEAYARHWGRVSRNMGMLSNRELADLEAQALSLIPTLTPEQFVAWVGMDSVNITHSEIDTFWAADKLDLPANQVDPETVAYSQDFLYLADAAPDVIPSSPATQSLRGRELPIFFKGTASDALDIGIRDAGGSTRDFYWTLWHKTGVVDRIHTSTLGGFGTVVDSGTVTSTLGSVEHVQVTLPETGDYYLRVRGGGGAEIASSTHALSAYASRDINEIYWPGGANVWFYVPPGTNGFVVNLSTLGNRIANVIVSDSQGNVLFNENTNELQVVVPQSHDNEVWRIQTSVTGGVRLMLLGIPPYVAGDPNDLLVPVEALHPFVAATEINRGAQQRSTIKELAVQFSESVNVEKADLSILGVDLSGATFSYNAETNTGTWDLTAVPLTDDYYTATLSGTGITDSLGNEMDGDRNGYGGDDYGFQFHRLGGDANGDTDVNVGDLGILGANYGTSGNWWELLADLNADGVVNVGDLGILGAGYGNALGGGGGAAAMGTSGSGHLNDLASEALSPVDLLDSGKGLAFGRSQAVGNTSSLRPGTAGRGLSLRKSSTSARAAEARTIISGDWAPDAGDDLVNVLELLPLNSPLLA